MTLGLVLISWSCSLTHMMLVTMEAQQTTHDTELNDRWDVESRSKWGWAGGSRRDCGQIAVTGGEV